MKKIILFYLISIPLHAFSQSKVDVVINWGTKKEISVGESKFNIPYTTGPEFSFNEANKSILFTLNVGALSGSASHSVELSNVSYESISETQIGDLASTSIPTEILPVLTTSNSRGVKQSFLSLIPIIKDEFGFKKILSFSYTMTSLTNAKTAQNNRSTGISNSVLASGDWYQFYIEKSGVYKISRSFLQQLGLSLTAINPKKIKIYGNGGRMLPLSNAVYYPNDLTENAIQIIGEADGVFNNEDYILFYAEGVDTYNEESQTNNNLYDTKSYYYVTIQGGDGKRITNSRQPSGQSTVTISTFDDYQFHELDLVNIAKLGRQWYGEVFDIKNEQEFTFNFPNIDTTTPVKIEVNTASASFTTTSFKVSANGQDVATMPFSRLAQFSNIIFNTASLSKTLPLPSAETIKIKLIYDNNGVPGSKGYLQNIMLRAKRNLVGSGKQFQFQHDAAVTQSGIATYTISNAAAITQIWDITDLYNVTKVENPNQSILSFKANLGELRKYVALDASDFYTPTRSSKAKMPNQNLKGNLFKNSQGQFQDIDYVIIAPATLSGSANKLAAFHRTYSKLNVKIIFLEDIYNEFSSGKQDIAALRNCIKYIYENASTSSKRIKYVNLFGDASYDYKNRIPNNTNIVPIYHSMISNSKGDAGFASDDFFGLMDENEGNVRNFFGGIDIAVGRMIHDSSAQAEEMVNKIIEYHDEKSYGSWRNNIVMISDDSDKTSDATLQSRHNQLADKITSEKPFFNTKKIFLDAYIQEASAGGSRYPQARKDFFSSFEKGALVINYLGHGGEDGLASERLWEKTDGQVVNNQYRYPLFITITCDFSRFDNPSRPTAGEFTYWNPKGGAISMITTIREIGQLSAENFNDVLAKNLFSYESNQYTSIAEALRISKNSNPNSSTNVVFYIGDPALMLAIPKAKVQLTKVNDVPVSQPTDDFKSLSKMKISGEVTDENNAILTNYNGELSTIIFDKFITSTTLNNDGNSSPISFGEIGKTIFRGNATVKNGLFEFSFIVPRDIRVALDTGKISFYTKRNQLFDDKAGFDTSIKIGGINENAAIDATSPRLKLYMNDETFVSGGITNNSPFMLAFLEDESGLNTAGGIGHDMIVILDNNVENPFVVNDYYQTNKDDFTKGNIRFPFRNLIVGLHTLTFKAWDVYNNLVTAEIQFVVIGNESITLTNVLNYPNPFVNYTEFWFSHNRPFEPLEVQVQVMTITGKIVWSKNQIIATDGFLSKEISWDGKDDFGDKIGKGVYIYKLTVKSNLTNSKTEKIEKLVIL